MEEVTFDESWLSCDAKHDLNGNEGDNKMNLEDQECSRSLNYTGSAILESQHIQVDKEWVKTGRTCLLASNKRMILNGEELDDVILIFAQKLLKKQFPNIGGLQNPVLQGKKKRINAKGLQYLQMIHSYQNH